MESVNLPQNGKQELKIEVKQVESPRLYVTESEYDPLFPRMTIILTERGEASTHLIWEMESRNSDNDFITSMLPGFKAVIRERAIIAMKNLKEILERK